MTFYFLAFTVFGFGMGFICAASIAGPIINKLSVRCVELCEQRIAYLNEVIEWKKAQARKQQPPTRIEGDEWKDQS